VAAAGLVPELVATVQRRLGAGDMASTIAAGQPWRASDGDRAGSGVRSGDESRHDEPRHDEPRHDEPRHDEARFRGEPPLRDERPSGLGARSGDAPRSAGREAR
jgi:hypothetical protein